jgi:hypothetical protein
MLPEKPREWFSTYSQGSIGKLKANIFFPPILAYSRLKILSNNFPGWLVHWKIILSIFTSNSGSINIARRSKRGRVQRIDPKTCELTVKNDVEIIADALTSFEEH